MEASVKNVRMWNENKEFLIKIAKNI